MSDKVKTIDPSKYNITESGQVLRSLSSEQYIEQEKALKDAIVKSAYEAGKTLQYQKENGEWVDFSKNTVCDDFKFQEHLNYRIKPSENNPFKPSMIKYDGHEYEAYKDGVKYKSTDGKNWVLAPEHQNCKTHYVLAEHDYNKIQNYIEAIRLIAEKVGTAESDCIEQLARDVGNYLYDLVKGDKN